MNLNCVNQIIANKEVIETHYKHGSLNVVVFFLSFDSITIIAQTIDFIEQKLLLYQLTIFICFYRIYYSTTTMRVVINRPG